MTDRKAVDAEETRREKARNLRHKKPIVKDINLWTIQEKLDEIYEECTDFQWYMDSDDDTLLNALDGNEDEEYEFKMMFADLCAECEQMREDLENAYVPDCFDDFFVAIGAGEYGGGLLGWDSYEQDYFGLECTDSFAERESAKRLMRLTKSELIGSAQACLKVLYAYLGIQNRYDNLKAAMDILRDENTGYLQVVKQIEECYDQAEKDSLGFRYKFGKGVEKLDNLLRNLPQEAESAKRKCKKAYSFDNENYSGVCDTDREALDEALMDIESIRRYNPKQIPDTVYIGNCEFFEPSLAGSSWDIIEAVLQQVDDEGFEEWTDGYLSDIPIEQREELEEGLEKVFQEWIDKYNYHATFFIVTSYDVYSYDKDKHELFREARASAECPRNIHLWHIGRDSNSRPVYKDEQEKFWKDVNPRADCPAKLCSALDNAFDGEPDTPMEYMERYQNVKIHFIPKRDTW